MTTPDITSAILPAHDATPIEVPEPKSRTRKQRKAAGAATKKTLVCFVLDASGSMATGKDVTINGYNEQVDIVKANAAAGGDVRMSLVTFNDPPVQATFVNEPVERLSKLDVDTYRPDKMTALYDAIGMAISLMRETPGAEDPDTAILVAIFTDGQENRSVNYTGAALREQIAELKATGRWTFTLMGPNTGLRDIVSMLQIDPGNCQGFDPQSVASRAESMVQLSGATQSYFAARAAGELQASALYQHPDVKA